VTRPARVAVAFLLSIAAPAGARQAAPADQTALPSAVTYFCPMHPDVVAFTPGACRKCGMALVEGDSLGAAEYRLEVETVPRAVRAGQPARFRFIVFHPESGARVREFAVVHNRPCHLFIVSQDLNHFFHVHPEQASDGSFSIELTLPRPGYYKMISDSRTSSRIARAQGRASR
jgi:hypothetical protein